MVRHSLTHPRHRSRPAHHRLRRDRARPASSLAYVTSGCIKTPARASCRSGCKTILDGLARGDRARTSPQQVAVEKVFVNVNPQSTLLLGQARGAAICAAVLRGPAGGGIHRAAGQAGGGRQRPCRTRSRCRRWCKRLLKLPGDPRADAADALACAICHAHGGLGPGRAVRRSGPARCAQAGGSHDRPHLTGTLLEKNPPQVVVVDVQGVGYEVDVPMSTFYNLPRTGERGRRCTPTWWCARTRTCCTASPPTASARPSASCSRSAASAPQVALAVLSGLSVADLPRRWRTQEPARLTKIPGIGKKTAERLLLELQDKLPSVAARGETAPAQHVAATSSTRCWPWATTTARRRPRSASCRRTWRSPTASARRSRCSPSHDRNRPPDRRRPGFAAGGGAGARAAAAASSPSTSARRRSASSSRSSSRPRATASEALDHVLLFGPPGLGKTTLAHIIAREMGVNLRQTSGPVLERAGRPRRAADQPRAATTCCSSTRSTACRPVVEEILYPALEDYQIDIMIGEGPAARSVKLDLPPFTLVGATTRAGMLTNPLRDRFGIVARLEFYTPEELSASSTRSAGLLRRARSTRTARWRSRAARAARRASPTACCAACATSPR